MAARRFPALSGLAALLLLPAALASAAPRLVVQHVALAGFAYHDAAACWSELHEGDALVLQAEPGNVHDDFAIQVRWQGCLLGYLPRTANGPAVHALRRQWPLQARIERLRQHPDPRQRILIELSVPLRTRSDLP